MSNYLRPSETGLRKPTDADRINGVVVNPPRYSELGGLTGPGKVATTVSNSKSDIGNPFHISKPNGGRG
jgi:hypothetical protein